MWSDTVIDDFPTVAEYVVSSEDGSENDLTDLIYKNEEWRLKHVRESQYLLQIVKCNDENCCSTRRSSLFNVLRDGFLPPPIPIKQTKNGLSYSDHICSSTISEGDSPPGKYLSLFQNLSMGTNLLPDIAHQKFAQEIPYDFSCPSVKARLSVRTCKRCCRYFGSIASLTSHFSSVHTYDEYKHGNKSLSSTPAKVKPERILVRRGLEVLCMVKTSSDTDEFDWFMENEIDLSDVNMDEVPEAVVKSGIKVYTEKERCSMWKNN